MKKVEAWREASSESGSVMHEDIELWIKDYKDMPRFVRVESSMSDRQRCTGPPQGTVLLPTATFIRLSADRNSAGFIPTGLEI